MTTFSLAHSQYALVTETWKPQINGVANTLGRLHEGLLRNHHRVQLIRPAQPGETAGFTDDGSAQELRVPGAPLPGYPGLQFGWPATRQLKAYWQRQRPDAVYLATEGPLGHSALAAAEALDIPTCSGLHTRFDQYAGHYRGANPPLVFPGEPGKPLANVSLGRFRHSVVPLTSTDLAAEYPVGPGGVSQHDGDNE